MSVQRSIGGLKHYVTTTCKSFFFSPSTLKFFRSKVVAVYPSEREGATFFVTSEQYPHENRKYVVRRLKSCKIETVGDRTGDGSAARKEARSLAAGARKHRETALGRARRRR